MGSDDLIDFEIIENQKENIQSLPSGRSAKALAQLFTPPLTSAAGQTPSPAQTQDANSAVRLRYEKELMAIGESDDPLDVYDRYVKWTLDAYPSAQNTPQSQLCTLLERATKAFQSSPQYKNDARYLKLWLHYIRFFADAPREIYAYLARHNIGDGLALYYEEFAAWLESAGRFTQAEEIYNLGIERNARPVERLVRKYGEFQHRLESRTQEVPEPTSPALPAIRPALAAKVDPFTLASPAPAAQTQSQQKPAAGPSRSGKPKLAIFSDGDEPARTSSSGSQEGWDSIGSLADRKKENTTEARPWAGETLKVGKKNTGLGKMTIFKDETKSNSQNETTPSSPHPLRDHQQAVNPRTGRLEVVFVDLASVYPNIEDPMSEEYSFEELRARHRGWLNHDWDSVRRGERAEAERAAEATSVEQQSQPKASPLEILRDTEEASKPKVSPLAVLRDVEEEPAKPLTLQPKSKASPLAVVRDNEEPKPKDSRLTIMRDSEEAPKPKTSPFAILRDTEEAPKPRTVPLKGSVDDANDENVPPSQAEIDKAKAARRARREEKANRTRKIKVMDTKEVRGEPQTIQTNLDSPVKPKIRRKKTGPEATMTLHTKEAMDEIYGIFNQPLKTAEEDGSEIQSPDESSEEDDDDYSSAGESTGTGRMSGANSDFGDETTAGDFTLGTRVLDTEIDGEGSDADGTDVDDTDGKSVVSAWSDFTESKHVPKGDQQDDSDEESEQSEGDSFDQTTRTHVEPEAQHDSDPDLITPTSPGPPGSLPTRFVPVPPEDYEHSMRPYRDPVQAANNRLPFMTPIVEKTESSLGFATAYAQKDYFAAKTPSRSRGAPVIFEDDGEPCSSPFSDLLGQVIDGPGKVAKLALLDAKSTSPKEDVEEPKRKPLGAKDVPDKPVKPNGPIILDAQCNPVDETIRKIILQEIQPPLDSYDGYYADTEQSYGKGAEIRKYTKAVSKLKQNANDKTITNLTLCPTLNFPGSDRTYTVKRELGKGAFAPVYLVESQTPSDSDNDEDDESAPVQLQSRKPLEAIKMEDPPTPWEFYMMRCASTRLGTSRPATSIVRAHEMHVFRDECYLVEDYLDQGTLLDLVNLARAENGVMDEQLAMFFTIELFRTVEALHKTGVIHGDLKADNILVRFDTLRKDEIWSAEYARDGANGWAAKGISLIDFGRGIDMRVFTPHVQFIADWPTTDADCAEMRELRPWTYQIDYHGLAGIIHNLLFGKYISTVAEKNASLGAAKTYKIKESLKRYWQTDIWADALDLLLNPLGRVGAEEDARMPVVRGMREVREKMEGWLEVNCEKGVGLKAAVRRMEEAVKRK